MGSTGLMIRVQREPTTATKKILVWMRPFRVGSTGRPSRRRYGIRGSDRLVPDPLPPLGGGASRSQLLGEALLDQVVGDLLCSDLQAEERVHPREGAAERGAAGGVHLPGAARGPDDLEVRVDVQPPHRIAADAGVVHQVGQHAVLADVGLEAGAVDDRVERADLRALVGGDADLDQSPGRPHLLDLADDHAVPALAAAAAQLLLPVPADRGVGAAHLLVQPGPLLALGVAHLLLELAAPDRLRVVEALVGPAVGTLAALEDARSVRLVDVGAEQVEDLRLQSALV